MAEYQRGATEFVAVEPETARAFMEAEAQREVSPKTWNDVLKLLRATFKHLHPHLNDGLDGVIAATGVSRGTVSNYLNELERETGASIVRSHRRAAKTDGLQKDRENGLRRASLHDFHSFRVTWITLALAAGVAMELVQRVTGHRTVEVVMKHYFRPGREDFRQVLAAAMPKMLGEGSAGSPQNEMRRIVGAMTERTWKRDRERLLKLLAEG